MAAAKMTREYGRALSRRRRGRCAGGQDLGGEGTLPLVLLHVDAAMPNDPRDDEESMGRQ